jgi:PKD repeat protein
LAAAMSATPTSGQAPLNVTFTGSATGGTAP